MIFTQNRVLVGNNLNILYYFMIFFILFSFMYLEFNGIFDLERKTAERKERQQCTMYPAEGNGVDHETKFLITRS